jgi:hypothetical protein
MARWRLLIGGQKKRKETKMKNTYSGEVVKGNVGQVFRMDDGKHYLGLSGIDPDAYPLGTRITVTLEEPEPPKERIVLPEGMKWDGLAMLWTADGTLIAKAFMDRDGWYRIPFMLSCVSVEMQTTLEDTKRAIEAALAEHGYFGVRKVVDNE